MRAGAQISVHHRGGQAFKPAPSPRDKLSATLSPRVPSCGGARQSRGSCDLPPGCRALEHADHRGADPSRGGGDATPSVRFRWTGCGRRMPPQGVTSLFQTACSGFLPLSPPAAVSPLTSPARLQADASAPAQMPIGRCLTGWRATSAIRLRPPAPRAHPGQCRIVAGRGGRRRERRQAHPVRRRCAPSPR